MSHNAPWLSRLNTRPRARMICEEGGFIEVALCRFSARKTAASRERLAGADLVAEQSIMKGTDELRAGVAETGARRRLARS